MPTEQEPRPSRREPPQDLVGLTPEDRRVVERASELEERDVEDDRHDDQQDRGDDTRLHQPESLATG
jgi:hypothetical protein